MADIVYNSAKSAIFSAEMDLSNGGDEIRAVLVTSAYTPNAGTHSQYQHITNQITGTGYTAGGQALTNQSVSIVSNKAVFDADNVVWGSSTITARAIVLYKYVDSGGSPAATSPLLAYWDSGFDGGDKSSEDGNFTITWGENGILRLDVAA